VLKWKLSLFCLEIVLILMQDRCMVCMEDTICSEINLGSPDDVCHIESRIGLFRKSVSFSARVVHDLCLIHYR